MRENHHFVVPVNVCAHMPCFLGLHNTLPCVSITLDLTISSIVSQKDNIDQ